MKQKRHLAILHLVSHGSIHTQQELTDELAKMGLETTQATVYDLGKHLSENWRRTPSSNIRGGFGPC